MLVVRKVMGHSMLPVLPPGTTVYGLKRFRKLKPGRVIIVLIEGKEKIKRVDQVKDNQVFVVDDHPDGTADSHDFGWLPEDSVVAQVVWPRAKAVD
jgi:phage repressor protein C with HTH and peptisase S24 domain